MSRSAITKKKKLFNTAKASCELSTETKEADGFKPAGELMITNAVVTIM